MHDRFEGPDGRRRLETVLGGMKLVAHNEVIARKSADIVKCETYTEKKQVYVRGEPGKNVLYLVLSGSIDLLSQDKHVASLEAGQFVGEFPILDPSLSFTLSVFAHEDSVIASVTEEQFLAIASDHPEIWRNMAKELAHRLRAANAGRGAGQRKPGEITVGELWSDLTIPQLWTAVAAIIGALSVVATVAYKLGGGN